MEITDEYIQDLVENRSYKDEHTFGIQKFRSSKEAFDVMDEDWGERNPYGFSHLVVGKESFLQQVYNRIADRYYEYKTGKVDEEKFKRSMGWDKYVSDYLLSFNFFFYSTENRCYYTSMMEFGDDFNSVLSKRQWKIYFEIFDTYRLSALCKEVVDMLDREVKADYGEEPLDDGFFDLSWNCFVDFYDGIREKVYGKE